MTRRACARVAGVAYLFYIAVALPSAVLFGKATRGDTIPAKLATIVQHATLMRVSILLTVLSCFSAVVLAVALYGVTRDEDHELAVLGMLCRLGEGVIGAAGIRMMLGLQWLSTVGPAAGGLDSSQVSAVGGFLLVPGSLVNATFFAAGSTVFCYLLLRGRLIPAALAWLGLLASILLLVALPLQLVGFLKETMLSFVILWLPMLVFELTVAVWFLVKGVAERPARV